MKCDIITIFPEIFHAYLNESIMKRAIQKGLLETRIHNLRDYTTDKHRTVDDSPYGGGAGMVMKPEPFFAAVETVCPDPAARRTIMLSPAGKQFKQEMAVQLSVETRDLVFLCGRYEAVDERVRMALVDDELSIGDYVLTGGELPALVIIDAVARLVPGVLGDFASAEEESFSWGLLDYPHYTRPEHFQGMSVPGILLSGNHSGINRWRKKQAIKATQEKRPDLLERYLVTDKDKKLLEEIKEDGNELDRSN